MIAEARAVLATIPRENRVVLLPAVPALTELQEQLDRLGVAVRLVPRLADALERALDGRLPKPVTSLDYCKTGVNEGKPHGAPWPLGRCPYCAADRP